ncbi:MAG: DbpA RNA binding domain-containing protein [Gemmatimonadota bacterium]
MTEEKTPTQPLSPEQIGAAAELGYAPLPEVVEALAVAVQRGHHVALLAGEGSGRELLYGLAAAIRCVADPPRLEGLALCATRESAARVARAVRLLNRHSGLRAFTWSPDRDGEAESASFLAGRPQGLLRAVRTGALSTADLRLLIVDDVEALQALGDWPAAEVFLDTLETEGQKILCARSAGGAFDELVERRLPRARRWPPELLGPAAERGEPGKTAKRGGETRLWYAPAAGEEARLDALAKGLRRLAKASGTDRALVHCRDGPTAHRAAAHLEAAGFRLVEDPAEPGVGVAWAEERAAAEGVNVLTWLPTRLADLLHRLEPGREKLVVISPLHVPQLRLMALRAGWAARELSVQPTEAGMDAVARFRSRLRAAIEQGETGAELLLLEPLLEEFGPLRVATALTRVKREEEIGEGSRTLSGSVAGEPALRSAWTRLYLNVGKRDGVGPGDLVGAITGETGARGAHVGKIEIRGTYSLVEVDSQIAEEVIRGLMGTHIRGREIVARPDRER